MTGVLAVVGPVCVAQTRTTQTTTLKAIVNSQNVISVVPWSVKGSDFLAVVSEERETVNGEIGFSRALTIYAQSNDALTKTFEYKTLDGFVSAYPLAEIDGRLLVAWTGGSAYHFTVYAASGDTVTEVLKVDSRGMPEIVIGHDEEDTILITQKQFVQGEWRRTGNSKTDIYVWNGGSYKLARTVPWNARFAAIAN